MITTVLGIGKRNKMKIAACVVADKGSNGPYRALAACSRSKSHKRRCATEKGLLARTTGEQRGRSSGALFLPLSCPSVAFRSRIACEAECCASHNSIKVMADLHIDYDQFHRRLGLLYKAWQVQKLLFVHSKRNRATRTTHGRILIPSLLCTVRQRRTTSCIKSPSRSMTGFLAMSSQIR